MIQKFDSSEGILGTYQGIEMYLVTDGDSIIFSPTKEVDIEILSNIHEYLIKAFPKLNVIMIPYQMTIQVLHKEN